MKTLIAILISCVFLTGCPKPPVSPDVISTPKFSVVNTYNQGKCIITKIEFQNSVWYKDSCEEVKFVPQEHYQVPNVKIDPIDPLIIIGFL